MVVGRALECLSRSSATLVPEMAEFKLPSRQLTQVAKCRASAFRDGNVVDLFKAGDWEWARQFVSPQDPGP